MVDYYLLIGLAILQCSMIDCLLCSSSTFVHGSGMQYSLLDMVSICFVHLLLIFHSLQGVGHHKLKWSAGHLISHWPSLFQKKTHELQEITWNNSPKDYYWVSWEHDHHQETFPFSLTTAGLTGRRPQKSFFREVPGRFASRWVLGFAAWRIKWTVRRLPRPFQRKLKHPSSKSRSIFRWWKPSGCLAQQTIVSFQPLPKWPASFSATEPSSNADGHWRSLETVSPWAMGRSEPGELLAKRLEHQGVIEPIRNSKSKLG